MFGGNMKTFVILGLAIFSFSAQADIASLRELQRKVSAERDLVAHQIEQELDTLRPTMFMAAAREGDYSVFAYLGAHPELSASKLFNASDRLDEAEQAIKKAITAIEESQR
jgi:hypothetical protein